MLFIENLTQEQIDRNRAWIKALRSGEYKQGQNWLRNNTGYCCLGVACNIDDSNRWQGAYSELYGGVVYRFESNSTTLPKRLLEKHGLTQLGANSLADMNDDGKSFREIADFIESELDEKAV